MKYELFQENRHKILLAGGGVLVLALISLCIWGVIRWETAKNDRMVSSVLEQLSYTEDTAVQELEELQAMEDTRNLSMDTRGQLYRAMGEITYMTGDETLYNRYIAYAIYYLRQSGDEASCVYLINKYVGRLYANGCYSAAEELLQELGEKTKISALSLDQQAEYYLSYADITQQLGKDESDFFAKSQAAIALMPESSERGINQAKLDILTARKCINAGQFQQAEDLMSGYSADDDFGLGIHQVYVSCDFRIPYYEIMAKISLNRQDKEAVKHYTALYMEDCDNYQFRAMKLQLLHYLAQHDTAAFPEESSYAALEKAVSQENMEVLVKDYGQFLLTDINAATKEVTNIELEKAAVLRRISYFSFALLLCVILYCVALLVFTYMGKDGLTHLGSRRQYEKMRVRCEHRHIPHCLLIMDIDDFKKVNDNFGHVQGDTVLIDISAILRSYAGRGIFCFRYGGEELCMMLLHVPEARSREIAQEICRKVEETVSTPDMHITVSIGAAASKNGENIFLEADRHLYEAKRNGKNQVR